VSRCLRKVQFLIFYHYSCDSRNPVHHLSTDGSNLMSFHELDCGHVAGTDNRNVPLLQPPDPTVPRRPDGQQATAGAVGGYIEGIVNHWIQIIIKK